MKDLLTFTVSSCSPPVTMSHVRFFSFEMYLLALLDDNFHTHFKILNKKFNYISKDRKHHANKDGIFLRKDVFKELFVAALLIYRLK